MTGQEMETLVVKLTGDGSEYQKMLQQAEAQTQKSASLIAEASKRIEGFSSSLKGFAQSALSVMASFGAMGFLKGAFADFQKMESGQIRLKAAIEGNGRAADATVARYQAFAASISGVTLQSKGEILNLLKQAETFGKTGEAAENLVKQSIGLAEAGEMEASHAMTLVNALQRGNVEMLRRVPMLRGIKDNTELVAKAQQLMSTGLNTQQKLAESSEGKMLKLEKSIEGIRKQFGAIVAEAILPWVEALKKVTDWMGKLDDGTKRTIVLVAALTAGILLLPPAISTVTFLLSPFIAALGAIVSPAGVAVAAVAALVASWAAYTESGAEAVDYVQTLWTEIAEDAQIGVKGVQNAIKAGNIPLAFDIAWTQVKLTFMKATQSLQEAWHRVVGFFKIGMASIKRDLTDGWNEVIAMAKKAQNALDPRTSQKTKEAISKNIDDMLAAYKRGSKQDFENTVNDIRKQMEEGVAGVKKTIDDLQDKRDDLAEDAGFQALPDHGHGDRPKLTFDPIVPKIPNQKVNAELKFDNASLSRSAEALSRLSAYRDLVARVNPLSKENTKKVINGEIGGGVGGNDMNPAEWAKFQAELLAGDKPQKPTDQQLYDRQFNADGTNKILIDIRDALKNQDQINLEPADVA